MCFFQIASCQATICAGAIWCAIRTGFSDGEETSLVCAFSQAACSFVKACNAVCILYIIMAILSGILCISISVKPTAFVSPLKIILWLFNGPFFIINMVACIALPVLFDKWSTYDYFADGGSSDVGYAARIIVFILSLILAICNGGLVVSTCTCIPPANRAQYQTVPNNAV